MKNVLFFVLLFVSVLLNGQTTVEGIAVDSTSGPLVGATVLLLNPADSVMVSFGLTNGEGRFRLGPVAAQDYTMQITYVGYGTFERSITVDGAKKQDLGTINLTNSIQQLGEVTVTAAFIPIVVKKDTIEYNADAFKVRPNASVEDLLKELPGIEVEDDGSITAQGEDVQRVTVDGKKFFGDDPKMATRNLPADAVNKVQVIDEKSKKAQFTGVDDGDREKVINLELKDDKKQGVFGDVMGGYGTDGRFDSKINVNRFQGAWQMTALGSYNNINEQGFSYQDLYGLTGGRGRRGNSSFNPGISESLSGGFNVSYNPSDTLEVTGSYFISDVTNNLISTTKGEYFRPAGSYFVSSDQVGTSTNNQHNIDLEIEYNPDTTNRFEIELDLAVSNADLAQDESSITDGGSNVGNTVDQTNEGNNDNIDWGGEIEYGRKLKKAGRSISVSGEYGQVSEDDLLLLDQQTTFVGMVSSMDSLVLQRQVETLDNDNYNLRFTWTEPIAKDHYLDINLRQNNTNNNSIREFFDLDPADQTMSSLNTALSAAFDNTYQYRYAGIKLNRNKAGFNLSAGLNHKWATISGQVNQLSEIRNSFAFLLPSLSLNWTDKRLRIAYSTATQEPSIVQLSPIVDNSDPTNLYAGNPQLNPEYTHTVNARWYFWDSFTFRNFFANARLAYTRDNIVTARVIDDQFIRRSTPVNVEDLIAGSASLNYGSPIRKLRIKARASARLSYSNGLNFINGVLNDVTSTSETLSLRLENLDNDVVSIRVGGRWSWSQNRYDISDVSDPNFLTQRYNSDVLVDLGKGWTWDNEVEHYIYSQEAFGSNNRYTLWTTSLQKTLLNDRLSLRLTVFDVLGQNQGINRSSGADYLSETTANAITRYGMVRAIYKLSEFGGGRRFNVIRM